VASVLLAACSSAPTQPDGAMELRSKLMILQSEQELATRAPLALKDAEAAVRIAELPTRDVELATHRLYVADRRIDIARAQAETRLSEDQRTALSAQRETARLDARTREADAAKSQVASAQADADAANLAAASADAQSAELQRQIDALQARPTDRGLVLTLGDVLFATGRAELKSGAVGNLDRLVAFLGKYPGRNVVIEGYTDSVGGDDYNLGLSQRRADAVRSYLTGQGVAVARLTSTGKGEGSPVADNDSASGRQQNRRVEVIIDNPPMASR
jgi:outer membrane protein OmpA-like peptidoglycan-associated protein